MKIRHLFLAFFFTITPPEMYADDIDNLIYAIGTVESNHDDNAVGDQGRSIGRYQIMRAYHADALEFDPSIGGKYEDVRDPIYAAKVMRAYWRRYARAAYEAGDYETLARIHNGGPTGHRKAATVKYWVKVRRELANK